MIVRTFFSIAIAFALPTLMMGCLKTRSEMGETQQSQVYGKKMAENQKARAQEQVHEEDSKVDDRDELIRTLNGRLETMENQINQMKAKEEANAQNGESQKIATLQEALVKMEAQLAKLEAENSVKSSDTVTKEAMKETAKEVSHPKPGSSDSRVQLPKTKPNSAKPVAPDVAAASTKKVTAYDTAEEHFSQKEWKKAILSYQKYVEEYPRGRSVADSKYKIGVSFQELGLKDEAMAFYEEVIAQYGKTEAGKKAKIRLSKIKK